MNFEWNPEKAAANLRKHQIAFAEAATVFADAASKTVFDEYHSTAEDRYLTIGMSDVGRVLLVSHTDRNDNIRIISARKATRREREFYERP
ncbi:MAG: BrnT family toxin [Planctomycetes bacterium]|nr:BrnT family toxin [Planctomycetota bacterium]